MKAALSHNYRSRGSLRLESSHRVLPEGLGDLDPKNKRSYLRPFPASTFDVTDPTSPHPSYGVGGEKEVSGRRRPINLGVLT